MVIDIILGLAGLLAFMHGFRKGLVSSLISFLALAISIIAAIKLSQVASLYISDWFNVNSKYLPLISLIAVFALFMMGFRLVDRFTTGLLKELQLGFINKLSGGVLWLAIAVFGCSTLSWYMNEMNLFTDQLKKESVTYDQMIELAPTVIGGVGSVVPIVKNTFANLEGFFEDFAGNVSENYEDISE